MNKLLLGLPLLAACSSPPATPGTPPAAAPPVAAPRAVDAQYGYGRHHFGDSLGSFQDVKLQLVPRPWPTTLYTIPSHTLRLGALPVGGISYEFWRGRLYRISFNSQQPGLLAAGQQLYGKGRPVSATEYWWDGQRASATYTENGQWTYLRIFDNAAGRQVDSAIAAAR